MKVVLVTIVQAGVDRQCIPIVLLHGINEIIRVVYLVISTYKSCARMYAHEFYNKFTMVKIWNNLPLLWQDVCNSLQTNAQISILTLIGIKGMHI